MAHDFAHAYSNVKIAVEGLVASDTLRVSLNRASEHFTIINDDDFNKTPALRLEFRQLRSRLRRDLTYATSSLTKSLDNTDDSGMKVLAENLMAYLVKMEAPEYKLMIPRPDANLWDDDRSLD